MDLGINTVISYTGDALERVALRRQWMHTIAASVRRCDYIAPQMHVIPVKLSIEHVICYVNKGMERAMRRIKCV